MNDLANFLSAVSAIAPESSFDLFCPASVCVTDTFAPVLSIVELSRTKTLGGFVEELFEASLLPLSFSPAIDL